MARTDNLHELPPNRPVPRDAGACRRLIGLRLPALALASTAGRAVDLSALPGRTVVYCYPRTGRPDREMPPGWNGIPGARGCTPQSCAFRDHHEELKRAGAAQVSGLSTQDTVYQREAVERLHLPFELLSDEKLEFARALGLPTFEVAGMRFMRGTCSLFRQARLTNMAPMKARPLITVPSDFVRYWVVPWSSAPSYMWPSR